MQSLLGHGEANGISPFLCALERDHAEWKISNAGCEMRLFVQRSGARSGDLVCRGMASPRSGNSVVLEACLPVPFLTCSVTASGNTPIAPCGTASFCFPGALQNKFENSGKERRSNFFRPAPNKALLGSWEHRPTSLISDPSKFGNSKRRHHHGNEPRNPHRQPRR